MIEVEVMITALESAHPLERERAKQQLIEIGAPAVDPLIAVIQAGQGRKCWLAVKALARILDERVVPTLIDALANPNPFLCETVVQELGLLGDFAPPCR